MTTSTMPVYAIKRVSFTVPGSRGNTYTVTADPKDGTIVDCTCPDHQHRHRECKHMRQVATPDHGGLKPRVRIGPSAMPPAPTPAKRERPWEDLFVD